MFFTSPFSSRSSNFFDDVFDFGFPARTSRPVYHTRHHISPIDFEYESMPVQPRVLHRPARRIVRREPAFISAPYPSAFDDSDFEFDMSFRPQVQPQVRLVNTPWGLMEVAEKPKPAAPPTPTRESLVDLFRTILDDRREDAPLPSKKAKKASPAPATSPQAALPSPRHRPDCQCGAKKAEAQSTQTSPKLNAQAAPAPAPAPVAVKHVHATPVSPRVTEPTFETSETETGIVLTCRVPGVTSASQARVTLSPCGQRMLLNFYPHSSPRPTVRRVVSLPFTVSGPAVSAKWDETRHALVLTLTRPSTVVVEDPKTHLRRLNSQQSALSAHPPTQHHEDDLVSMTASDAPTSAASDAPHSEPEDATDASDLQEEEQKEEDDVEIRDPSDEELQQLAADRASMSSCAPQKPIFEGEAMVLKID